MEHQKRLPRVVVDSPPLDLFKSHLNRVLGNWLYVALLEREFELDDLQRLLPTLAILSFCEILDLVCYGFCFIVIFICMGLSGKKEEKEEEKQH